MPRDDSVNFLNDSSFETQFDILRDILLKDFEAADKLNLVNLKPIASFKEYNLSSSSRKKLNLLIMFTLFV